MPSGEAFTEGQLRDITRAVTTAAEETGLHFSVFVGAPAGDPRTYAEKLHAALGPRAARAILLMVAPGSRRLEVVTGAEASRRVSDRACGLAALSMRTSFAGGDLHGGIVTGVLMLAEAAGGARAAHGIESGGLPALSAGGH